MKLHAVECVVLEPARVLALDETPRMAGLVLAAAERVGGWRLKVVRSVATQPGVRRKREGMSGPGSMGYVTEVREFVTVRGRSALDLSKGGAAWYQGWHRLLDEDAGPWSSDGGALVDSTGYRMMGITALTRYLQLMSVVT